MNKKSKVAVAGVATVALVGGTLAYWGSSSTINNPFSTKSYEGETVEKFNPKEGDGWEPGGKVDKQVTVKNTGDYPIYARVRFSETWTRDGKEISTKYPMWSTTIDEESADNKWSYNQNFFPGEDTGDTIKPDGDLSAVYKDLNLKEAAGTEDTSEDVDWIQGNDGWYYSDLIPENGKTEELLKYVRLLKGADMGTYEDVNWVSLDGENWEKGSLTVTKNADGTQTVTIDYENPKRMDEVITDPNQDVYQKVETTLKSGEEGFANADYTLTIITQLCQSIKNGDGTVSPSNWTISTAPGV